MGGAANYLLGVLGFSRAKVTHLPPSELLTEKILRPGYDAVILSDFSKKNLKLPAENLLLRQVESGTGLLMVGGWGSFSGPFGGWRGTQVESVLPVRCKNGDDRTNFPGGAVMFPLVKHPAIKGLKFKDFPAICGLNAVSLKKEAQPLLGVRRILADACCAGVEEKIYPLLAVSARGALRTAAFMTDFAPHWCGGLVDWGSRTLRLPVNSKIQIQVGDQYAELIRGIVSWTARKA